MLFEASPVYCYGRVIVSREVLLSFSDKRNGTSCVLYVLQLMLQFLHVHCIGVIAPSFRQTEHAPSSLI